MKFFKRIIAALVATSSLAATAEIPQDYYSSCLNKSGTTLLSALFSTVSSHTNVGYDGLWKVYATSDVLPNGKIWDMYSTMEWPVNDKHCGNYSKVGDCYNREHSLPKSWFKEANPMKSDAFHVYPTDGKVNGQRSNYPYGECSGGTTLPGNGSVKPLGRLGKCTYPGYSGTVFEPDDEYKGDFARTYFYMAACYYDKIANWNSDMLSGDKNTPYKSWAMEMLLKWHRQDPVSQKEIDRNDAVYAYQHNRNPFIDHPELAEYIWGDRKGQTWNGSDIPTPTIHQPQHGTEIHLGITRPGVAVTRNISILTSAATDNVAVTVIGGGFSVSHKSLPAATANKGTTVTLTYNPTTTGEHAATLRVTNGEAVHSVTIRGQSIDGLPAGPATYVTDESFIATWVFVGDADSQGNYTLSVKDDAGMLEGYPKAVAASAGKYEVTGLMPATDYTYTISSTAETSDEIKVTTADPIPDISFLFDGTLAFETTPGYPSEPAELVVDTDNIDGNFNVRVDAPFQISLDKETWSTSISLTPDDERLYMRLYSIDAGEFSTHIVATYGDYISDDAYAEGFAEIRNAFFEDFEAADKGNYTDGDVAGTACTWYMHDAGIYNGGSEPKVSGSKSVRFGKTTSSYIEMTSDIAGGIGTVSFHAATWSDDGDAKLSIETSTDGGLTYTPAGTVTVSGNTFKPYNVFVGIPGKARLKIRQTSGKRLNIDDIALSNFTTGCQYLDTDFHAWDAFARSGCLVIEVTRELPAPVIIYALDGSSVAHQTMTPGVHTIAVAPGLYIISVGDEARRAVVR